MELVKNKIINDFLVSKGMTEEAFNLLMNPIDEHDHLLLHDIEKGTNIVKEAIENKEKFCIMGDYDADGITSTTILFNMLRYSGVKKENIMMQVPLRQEGYGMNKNMVQKAIDNGVTIILTCDNGISCHESIKFAKDNGLKVVVTDHHSLSNTLPEADALIHPALGNYPFVHISGAQTAYKFSKMFTLPEHIREYNLQLAGISIISDVMPVGGYTVEELKDNENRKMLNRAIDSMRNHPNWHIKTLLEKLNTDPSLLDEKTLGFSISPVLNAIGRIDKKDGAMLGIKMMTSESEKEVDFLASYSCYLNETRKKIQKDAIERLEVDEDEDIIILVEKELEEGIVGIIAGNLCNKYNKPVIILTEDETGKFYKGSARSSTVNIYEALCSLPPETFVGFGGHAGAAGLSIEPSRLYSLITGLQKYVKENPVEEEECEVVATSYSKLKEAEEEIKKLKPFGQGFRNPEFIVEFPTAQLDYFFGSGHVKVSNNDYQEIWLFSKLDEFRESQFAEKMLFRKTMDNTEKRMNGDKEKNKAPMSYEEAWEGHWERWKGFTKIKFFLTADYGTFMNNTGLQVMVNQWGV